MERDEQRRADYLDWYWDAILSGGTLSKPPNVEIEAAAVIAHLNERPSSEPHQGVQERVRARIFRQARDLEDAMQTLSLPPPQATANSPTAPDWSGIGPSPRPTAKQPRWSAQLATALLLFLTLGLGFITLWPGHTTQEGRTGIPAIGAMATPPSAPALSTVFATTLPADQVPTAGNLDFLLWNVTLEPNTRGSASAQEWSCCPGPQITHVLAGELSVRVDGPLQVFRDSGGFSRVAEIPPGTEVTLHPGDTAVYSYELPAEYVNHGSSSVRMVGGGIFAGAVRNVPAASSHYFDYNEEYSVPQLPAGPLEATLVRATLPPAGSTPAPPTGALVLEVGASGDADIAQSADGSLRNIGPTESTIYVLILVPNGAGSATPMS